VFAEAQNTVFVRLLAGHTGTGGGKVGYQNITEERVMTYRQLFWVMTGLWALSVSGWTTSLLMSL